MKEFETILNRLKEHGIPVRESRYDEHVFGSWFIVVDSQPPYRIVHDGRDRTIVLEKMEHSEWRSVAADKTSSGKHVWAALLSELNGI